MESVKTGMKQDPEVSVNPTTGETTESTHSASVASLSAEQAVLQLAAIVESSDDAIVSKDLSGTVTSWNKAAERIFGYTAEEIIGKSITLIIPPHLQRDELMVLERIRAGQRIEHFHTVRMRKDGSLLDVSITVSPIRDRDGKVVGASKIARDITQEKKTDQDAQRLAAIVESSDDAIISKDLDGIVRSWNKAAERIFGYKAEEIIGLSITTIIPPELLDDEPRILAKLRVGERIDHFQTVRVRKGGERINVSLTVSPIRDHTGKVIGAAKIARDITHQKKMEEAIQLSERLASLGKLAATVAHEINNPLEAVTNFIYLARHQPDLPEKVKYYLGYADQELGRVAHIARQTLGFYRDNSYPTWVSVPELVDDVLTIYERKFKYKSLRIERRIDPGLTVYTLQGELKQILSNLIANAIDACKEGDKIVVHARKSHDFKSGSQGMRMTIADTGAGIAEADKAKLFAPFFTTKKDVGTGLGLWITKDLLERKGGYIRVRSKDSKPSGTVMSIYLPQVTPEKPAELVA